MKKGLSILLREQKGQALVIVLAMLALGGLLISPFLSLTATALHSGVREETRMYQQYAANAGISDGLLQIIVSNPQLPAVGDDWSYSIPDTNGRTVAVIISRVDLKTWRIASTATEGNGHSTELDCYVEEKRYLPNAITATSVTIKNGAVINGNVQYDSVLGTLSNGGTINGEIIDRPVEWPTVEEVAASYLEQVQSAPVHEGNLELVLGPSTVGHPYSLGPIRIDGNLTVNAPSEGALRLDGTAYVSGSVTVNGGVRMFQNNNNLYADGAGGINLAPTTSLRDAGAIVARHDISIRSQFVSTSYSIVWSLQGSVTSVTSGPCQAMLYSGEIDTAGTVTVEAGTVVSYAEPPPDLLLPPLLPGKQFKVVAWASSGT